MKIGLNGQYILIKDPAGPERFTINLFKALSSSDAKNEYILYLNSEPNKEFIAELFSNNPRFSYKVIKSPFLWTQLGLAYELFVNPVDTFFSAIHTFPILHPLKTKIVVMIHGLEYRTNKEFGKFSLLKLWHPFFIKIITMLANKIVVPSQSTKDALGSSNKILIINEGVSSDFRPRDISETQPVLDKYDLEYKKYLVFISTIQPRKNVANLIRAFADSSKNSEENIKLVLVGKLGWNYTDAITAPQKYNIENKVKFLNWIPQEDIYYLLSGALGYLNFSYDEGFGLTVLEAMASGIPVAVSDIQAHREVGENTIVYSDPKDLDSMTEAIEKIIKSEYENKLLDKALQKAKQYDWENTARRFIETFLS